MIELMPLALEQKSDLDRIFKLENSRSADFCTPNLYMWDKRFEQSILPLGDRLITKLTRNGEEWFAFPVGVGAVESALDWMKTYCLERGIPLRICGICKEHTALLNDEFELKPDRDFSDYIYRVDALAEYAGKHLHGKKNFCNRFEKEHKWHFEPLCRNNLPLCEKMLEAWHLEEADRLDGNIVYEDEALRLAFRHFEDFPLEGGGLFADGELIGFSMGEKISDDTFCVHFEKAFSRIAGAYPMVCREMARQIMAQRPEIRYVNREDDMGLESLRKSKLSYKPEYILEKYTAVWNRTK